MTTAPDHDLILVLSCPDRPGIVQAVSSFLFEQGGNIVEAAQFNDRESGLFFMRVRFHPGGMDATAPDQRADALSQRFAGVAAAFGMQWRLVAAEQRLRTLLMVSRLGHCLNDLLFRHRSGLLPIDIRGIVSNHRDFEPLADSYGLPFHHLPVTADGKAEAEARLLDVVHREAVELVVLARYMQVLSDALCRQLPGRIINIHHSFLPSFKGARPYHQAHARGVKLIGATAHYVTSALDEGPIIEQGIVRVDHAMTADALAAAGRDVESNVLARAVGWHAQHRIFLNGSRTVIFR